jgi:hypothetical protein
VADLSNIVKAYDVRGVVPEELNAGIARALHRRQADRLRARHA